MDCTSCSCFVWGPNRSKRLNWLIPVGLQLAVSSPWELYRPTCTWILPCILPEICVGGKYCCNKLNRLCLLRPFLTVLNRYMYMPGCCWSRIKKRHAWFFERNVLLLLSCGPAFRRGVYTFENFGLRREIFLQQGRLSASMEQASQTKFKIK